MGIESDQLVYDYLSRVGDVAQQQQLSSAARMRLVASLRSEIDRQRGTQSADSPAAVRRILGRLGTPDELVAAAAGSGGEAGAGAGELPQRPEPAAGEERGIPRPRLGRTGMFRKETSGKGASRAGTEAAAGDRADPADRPAPEAASGQMPLPPHRAGTDELGPSGSEPDWWRIEPVPFGDGVDVPGFVGGVEIPDMMRPPQAGGTVPRPRADDSRADDSSADGDDGAGDEDAGGDDAEGDGDEEAGPRRRFVRFGRRAPREGGAKGGGFSHPLLLLAAALLVTGLVVDRWEILAAGWLLAYCSRTLSRAEAKWVVMGLPGVVAAGALVWLWGRSEGRWGEPIADGRMSDAIGQTWPWAVRLAAVACALHLVWRARRPRS
ncbi:hypothetical protein AB0L71_05455 [Streptomyces sp. NPDC052052]|uniref:hypothetical protein n=1 Tax=Streptomyces sp. NPDC052052 TaxID=3154756 RepID=UPI00342E5258